MKVFCGDSSRVSLLRSSQSRGSVAPSPRPNCSSAMLASPQKQEAEQLLDQLRHLRNEDRAAQSHGGAAVREATARNARKSIWGQQEASIRHEEKFVRVWRLHLVGLFVAQTAFQRGQAAVLILLGCMAPPELHPGSAMAGQVREAGAGGPRSGGRPTAPRVPLLWSLSS